MSASQTAPAPAAPFGPFGAMGADPYPLYTAMRHGRREMKFGPFEAFLLSRYDDVLSGFERLRRYAEGRGRTLLELAISWLATSPQVTSVISGATRPEQVGANAAAASWKMSADERAAIDALLR